ncbi:sensor histidine kinase [Rhodococcus sp. ABRD24]|uniref:sensor histidine kinase n=1 Tax=Rhodococcus sp. ABRD24 TaxID=2507582 RepID=UPI00103F66BB|nr:histidine kinase [Rhodococcus sp. ABRD24]QBJ94683.1 sensor histidine kinase [Rhodococcus sp. ABRD24]
MSTMRYLRPVEHPADRSPGRWVFDTAVMMLAVAVAVPDIVEDPSHSPAIAIPALLIVLAPLAIRRVFPTPVLAWVLIASVVAGLWNEHIVADLGLLIALYTVASAHARREALVAAAFVGPVMVEVTVRMTGVTWWYAAIIVSGLVGAAVGLGLYSSTRRAYLAELRDRAVHLEYERDQQSALAAAAERARISREMHDIVAHHLTVMIALSEGAVAVSAVSPERGIEVMRTVSATGRRALADTRKLLGALRVDEQENDGGLGPVPDLAELEVLIERVSAAGLTTTLQVHGTSPDVPAAVQLTVYRLVQEALTNTLKHCGPGAQASVRLQHLPGELRVDVDDDGAGAAATLAGVGSGLIGMRERVHACGGDMHAGPRQSVGWSVSARLRLDEGDTT